MEGSLKGELKMFENNKEIKCPFCSGWGICEDVSIVEEIPCEHEKCSFFSSLKEKARKENEQKMVAVLSTTVLPLDGVYSVKTVNSIPEIQGIPHYIGHPDTKQLVEQLGAVQAASKLFNGLEVGQKAVCFPIQQGKSSRKDDGFTSPHQNISFSDLSVRIIERIR